MSDQMNRDWPSLNRERVTLKQKRDKWGELDSAAAARLEELNAMFEAHIADIARGPAASVSRPEDQMMGADLGRIVSAIEQQTEYSGRVAQAAEAQVELYRRSVEAREAMVQQNQRPPESEEVDRLKQIIDLKQERILRLARDNQNLSRERDEALERSESLVRSNRDLSCALNEMIGRESLRSEPLDERSDPASPSPWVSPAYRLPPDGEAVLGYTTSGRLVVVRDRDMMWEENGPAGEIRLYDRIDLLAWMPLPAPPGHLLDP